MSILHNSGAKVAQSAERDASYRRFWILALLVGVEKAGASPINIKQFNLLAYFANAVAACYDIEPINPILLKEKRGPLYPRLMFDVDRLVGMTLVRVGNLVLEKEGKIMAVSYSITAQGLECLERGKEVSSELEQTALSLTNTALAFCRAQRGITIQSMSVRDANLADTRFAEGDIVDFGAWDRYNATADAVRYVEGQIKVQPLQSVTNAVNLYARYLASQIGGE